MEELAERIIDLLREENLTIQSARLTLEYAIRILEQERLAPKPKSEGQ